MNILLYSIQIPGRSAGARIKSINPRTASRIKNNIKGPGEAQPVAFAYLHGYAILFGYSYFGYREDIEFFIFANET